MKDKIINLNVKLKDLDGKDIPNSATLGKILAYQLVNEKQGDILKFYDWALKLNRGEVLTLDRSDYEKLKDYVTSNNNMSILEKAQILPLLENDKILTLNAVNSINSSSHSKNEKEKAR